MRSGGDALKYLNKKLKSLNMKLKYLNTKLWWCLVTCHYALADVVGKRNLLATSQHTRY